MRTIKIEIHGRFPECHDAECQWTRECTQHRSAGDYRMECGLRPKWSGYDPVRNVAYCLSSEVQSDQLFELGEAFTIDAVPAQLSLI